LLQGKALDFTVLLIVIRDLLSRNTDLYQRRQATDADALAVFPIVL